MSKFDFQENNYFLNDKCIASSLTQVDETLSDLLVPSLKLVRTELCVASADIIAMSSDIYRNADSPVLSSRGLSGKVEFLLSSDRKAMDYGGTLRCIDPGEKRPYVLSNFMADNFGPDAFLKHGFTFRISSDQVFYPTATASAYVFSENDYFIMNRDTFVKNMSSADVDIIYDASIEGLLLSSRLDELSARTIADINYLSSTLSATVKVCELLMSDDRSIEEIAASYGKDHWNTGDIIIVKKHMFDIYDPALQEELKNLCEYVAYVYDADTDDPVKWRAMDGNYAADNVYFKNDITTAGAWSQMANVTKPLVGTGTFKSKGKSLKQVMEMILQGDLKYPAEAADNLPTAAISLNGQTVEVGTKITPSFTAKFKPTKMGYAYGSTTNKTSIATGIRMSNVKINYTINGTAKSYTGSWTKTHTDNNVDVWSQSFSDSSNVFTGIIASGQTQTINASGASLTSTYLAAEDGKYIPLDSVGNVLNTTEQLQKYRIAAGTATASSTANSIICQFKFFWGTKTKSEYDSMTDETGAILGDHPERIKSSDVRLLAKNQLNGFPTFPFTYAATPASTQAVFFAGETVRVKQVIPEGKTIQIKIGGPTGSAIKLERFENIKVADAGGNTGRTYTLFCTKFAVPTAGPNDLYCEIA